MRSDTVTKPDSKMVLAMMDAPVGDDVFGEGAFRCMRIERVGNG